MSFTESGCGRIGWCLGVVLIAFAFVGAMAPSAKAQQFNFTFSIGAPNNFANVVITLGTAVARGSGFDYPVQMISGTFQGNNIMGIPGQTVFGARTVQNVLHFNGSALPPNNAADFQNFVSDPSGFAFQTSAGNFAVDQEFGGFAVVDNVGATLGSTTVTAGAQVTPVPGPLAGAGMLSWLAVVLMGLFWRWQLLFAAARTWLADIRQGKAQTA